MGKVGKVHVEGRTREERVKVRKSLGKLSHLTVQAPTRKRYDNALALLGVYLKKEGLVLPRSRDELDPLLADYVEHLWSTGCGRALASDTLAAVQDKQPQVKGRLQQCWRLLRTWNANEIPNRAPPLPESALQAMVGYSIFHGRFTFALSLLVGFYGMLRTGELLAVKPAHLTQSSPKSLAVLALGLTKTGRRHGAAESITIGVETVTRFLWEWKKSYPPHSNLCQSPHQWRKMFSDTLVALNFEEYKFRPYSLRRGGATFWFGMHGSLDRLLIAGRWSAQKTARLYLNEGLAVLAELTLPWSKTNKVFLNQYIRFSRNPIPKLDPTSGRTGGRGGHRSKPSKKAHFLQIDGLSFSENRVVGVYATRLGGGVGSTLRLWLATGLVWQVRGWGS